MLSAAERLAWAVGVAQGTQGPGDLPADYAGPDWGAARSLAMAVVHARELAAGEAVGDATREVAHRMLRRLAESLGELVACLVADAAAGQ